MKTKLIALILSIAVTAAALTSCGSKTNSSSSSDSSVSQSSSQSDQSSVSENSSSSESSSSADSSTSEDKRKNVTVFDGSVPDPVDNIDYQKADNMKFYQDNMVVAGDSIAFGWKYCGVIPANRTIAQGGISTAGYSRWTYDTTGKEQSMIATMKEVRPLLLYISLGMNDVNNITPETYAEQYKSLIQSILSKVPDCFIVAASITPLAQKNDYDNILNNEDIKKYNKKLREMIVHLGKENVIYFNAFTTLSGEDGYMETQYDLGDGLHINGTAYKKILEEVSKRLNQELAMQRIQAYAEARKKK